MRRCKFNGCARQAWHNSPYCVKHVGVAKAAPSMSTVTELRRAVLDLYPIGSEWYDCAQDTCGKVILHIESRGVLMRSLTSEPTSLMAFGYTALLTSPARLITPRTGGYFFEWRAEREAEDEQYAALLKEHGLDKESVWG